jgi:hypothetical protein
MSRFKTLTFLCSAAIAQAASAQVPHTFTAGTPAKASEINENFAWVQTQLFYSKTTCPVGCQITKVNTAEDDRQVFATLPLPAGQYLVTAKLGVYNSVAVTYSRIECSLVDAANPANVDYASAATPMSGSDQINAVEVMQLPITFGASGGTVQVACRTDLDATSGNTTLKGGVSNIFGLSIMATRVSAQTASSTLHVISGNVTVGTIAGTATITLMQGGNTVVSALTNSAGFYSFGGLPDGTYTISATKAAKVCNPATGTVVLSGADATDNVTCN